jgi:hypothetical protein
MSSDQVPGPSAIAAWERHEVQASATESVVALALPDASNAARREEGRAPLLHAALAQPALARGAGGWPVFSLIILLRRMPHPGEAWAPLVERGLLNLDATLTPPPLAREALARQTGAEILTIFARDGAFRLAAPSGAGVAGAQGDRVLSEAAVAGSAPVASLAAQLSAEETLAVEAAYSGGGPEDALVLHAELGFRAAAAGARTTRLVGIWAEIHDALAALAADAEGLTEPALRDGAEAAMRTGALKAYELDAQGEHSLPAPLPEDAFRLFLAQAATMLLERLTPELPADDPANRYRLGARPHPAFTLDAVRRSSAGGAMRRLVAQATIGELLAQLRAAGMPRDAAIQFHVLQGSAGTPVPAAGGGATSPAPRLMRTGRGSMSRAPARGRAVFAEVDGGVRTLGAVLRTGASASAPSAAALIASDTVLLRPVGALGKAGWLDDINIVRPTGEPAPASLPVVGDPGADPWPDRLDPGKVWYAPHYVAQMPDPAGDASAGPFLFAFERTGATASGAVAIQATLRFQLRRETAPHAVAPGGQQAVAWTPTNSLAVTLHLPFVDDADGTPRTHPFPVQVQSQPDGSLHCSVQLANQWARLLYGAIAQPGFQSQPVRVTVAYSFPGYVRIGRLPMAEWLMLGKQALVPVASRAEDRQHLAGSAHFDAADGVIRYPSGEFRLAREPARAMAAGRTGPSQHVVGPPRRGVGMAAAAQLRPIGTLPPIVLRPQLEPNKALHQTLLRAEYADRTFLREVTAELLVPCSGFGMAYRDRSMGGDVAIGCQDALMLGRTEYRSHAEVAELATPRYRVFRSLQQVGRFLVVPTRYRIGRGDAAAGERAFAPAIAMFSVLDPDDDSRSRIAVEATLEPDLPPFVRQELRLALRAQAAAPEIDYPTEVARDVRFVWSLPPGLAIEPQALRIPNGFRVTLGTDLMGALLLQTLLCRDGVAASATFELPDGTSVPSVLEVGLAQVTGNWGTGPFAAALADGSLRLTNRTERPVDLTEVLVLDAAGAARRIPAEKSVVAGAAHVVVLPSDAVEAFPVYTVPPAVPATLEEVRSVVDRVTASVLFLDLVNHANHGLSRIELVVRLRGVPGEQTVGLDGDPGRGVATMVLPLTAYLANRTMEFQARKTFAEGRAEATPWIPWDLDRNGSVVSLTWELIEAKA